MLAENRPLSDWEKEVRRVVRGFLLTATREELSLELAISLDRKDALRARFVRELIAEYDATA